MRHQVGVSGRQLEVSRLEIMIRSLKLNGPVSREKGIQLFKERQEKGHPLRRLDFIANSDCSTWDPEGDDGLLLGRLEQESSELDRKKLESTGQRGMVRWYEVPLRVGDQGLTLDLTA